MHTRVCTIRFSHGQRRRSFYGYGRIGSWPIQPHLIQTQDRRKWISTGDQPWLEADSPASGSTRYTEGRTHECRRAHASDAQALLAEAHRQGLFTQIHDVIDDHASRITALAQWCGQLGRALKSNKKMVNGKITQNASLATHNDGLMKQGLSLLEMQVTANGATTAEFANGCTSFCLQHRATPNPWCANGRCITWRPGTASNARQDR